MAGVGAVVADLQGAGRRRVGVIAHGDGAADQQRIDFVEAAVKADGAVVDDAALGLEQEQVVEVAGGIDVAHVLGAARPLLQRGVAVQAAMGGEVVFAFEVGPQAPVEGVETGAVGRRQGGEQLGAQGAEEAFDLALALRLIGAPWGSGQAAR